MGTIVRYTLQYNIGTFKVLGGGGKLNVENLFKGVVLFFPAIFIDIDSIGNSSTPQQKGKHFVKMLFFFFF